MAAHSARLAILALALGLLVATSIAQAPGAAPKVSPVPPKSAPVSPPTPGPVSPPRSAPVSPPSPSGPVIPPVSSPPAPPPATTPTATPPSISVSPAKPPSPSGAAGLRSAGWIPAAVGAFAVAYAF